MFIIGDVNIRQVCAQYYYHLLLIYYDYSAYNAMCNEWL